MALFTESEVRAKAKAGVSFNESATTVLNKRAISQILVDKHDIFLSHAFVDKEIVLGAALMIEDLGYSVYIDWRDDPSLDRSKVTEATAGRLKIRMKSCKCLLYSTTSNASDSKWMPWELGYMDGYKSKAAILPIAQYSTDNYQGQEYLGIYPYVDVANDNTQNKRLWVRKSPTIYVNFDSWLTGSEPIKR